MTKLKEDEEDTVKVIQNLKKGKNDPLPTDLICDPLKVVCGYLIIIKYNIYIKYNILYFTFITKVEFKYVGIIYHLDYKYFRSKNRHLCVTQKKKLRCYLKGSFWKYSLYF